MEITANALQTIAPNSNVMFTDTLIPGNCTIMHLDGSGLVTLRAPRGNCQSRARFRISFSGNLKADTGATVTGVTPISLAISRDGEPIQFTTMTVSVGDTGSIYNISTELLIDVPSGCCATIAVKNISSIALQTLNASLIAERVA